MDFGARIPSGICILSFARIVLGGAAAVVVTANAVSVDRLAQIVSLPSAIVLLNAGAVVEPGASSLTPSKWQSIERSSSFLCEISEARGVSQITTIVAFIWRLFGGYGLQATKTLSNRSMGFYGVRKRRLVAWKRLR